MVAIHRPRKPRKLRRRRRIRNAGRLRNNDNIGNMRNIVNGQARSGRTHSPPTAIGPLASPKSIKSIAPSLRALPSPPARQIYPDFGGRRCRVGRPSAKPPMRCGEPTFARWTWPELLHFINAIPFVTLASGVHVSPLFLRGLLK